MLMSITNLTEPVNCKLSLHSDGDWRYYKIKSTQGVDDEKKIYRISGSDFLSGFGERCLS
jgi:hypothetical protein